MSKFTIETGCYERVNYKTSKILPLPSEELRNQQLVPRSLWCKWRLGLFTVVSEGDHTLHIDEDDIDEDTIEEENGVI